MSSRVFNVLFLCTGNSARSIMAEAILNLHGLGRFHAYSAGSRPAGRVSPEALQLLTANRFPTQGLRSKHWSEFSTPPAPSMDFVLTVCDNARDEVCPVWPGQPVSAHWGVADPVSVQGNAETRHKAFVEAFSTLNRRISLFVNLPIDKLDRMSLQHELGRIGEQN